MSEDSQAENALAVQEGYRILSAYTIHNIVFWIITEWDRSVTTILFPDEY
jgi:glycogen synthase